jgi:DNA-binding transcriptional ArsR family regulator
MKTKTSDAFELDPITLRKAAMNYRAINHQLRQKILQLLHQHKKLTVSSIYFMLRIEQSVTSQHLAILRKANLVINERDGKRVYYSINYPRLQQLKELAKTLVDPKKN